MPPSLETNAVDDERYLCRLAPAILLKFLACHRIDDKTLYWLLANDKYTVVSDLICLNGESENPELAILLANVASCRTV